MAPLSNSKKSLITTGKDAGICSELNRRFYWFDKNFTLNLTAASGQFLCTNLYYYLFSVTDKPNPICKGDEYFVTQIELTWDCPLYMKISSSAIRLILENSFGQPDETRQNFNLKNITELEAQLLTGFNEFIYQSIANSFKEKREIDEIQNLEDSRKNLIYLTFFIYSDSYGENETAEKVVISFPEYALKDPELLQFPENPIDILQFEESCTRADVFVGKSKISLDDLKNIESDDIVVLEKSNLHFMTIRGDEEVTFSVNPDPRLVINTDNTMGGKSAMNEASSSIKNIWDNLQVEVSAEFKKIKISLGELRQITEGLVIDVASIVQNEIVLHVDGEKIALGELVIIEDKYGVKITKVFPGSKHEQTNAVQEAARYAPPVQEQVYNESSQEYKDEEDSSEDEDFDYSDFEIEEDI